MRDHLDVPGLPTPPVNHIWRIHDHDGGVLTLELREYTGFFAFTRAVARCRDTDHTEDLELASSVCLDEWARAQRRKRWLGDYK